MTRYDILYIGRSVDQEINFGLRVKGYGLPMPSQG